MEKNKARLDEVLLESIDSALEVLGSAVKESLMLYLEKEHSIPHSQPPKEVEQFTIALRHLLGYGSKVVEKIVVRNVVEKCKIPKTQVQGKSLAEILQLASQNYHPGSERTDAHETKSSFEDFGHSSHNRRLRSA